MTFFPALLVVTLSALVLLGILAAVASWEKKRPSRQYDERQQAARGKAFQWAFMVGVLYFGVIALLEVLLPQGLYANLFLVIMIGLSLEAFVSGCYCILHDAYLPLTKSPKANIIMLYVMGAAQLLSAASNVNFMRISWTESGVSKVSFFQVQLNGSGQSAIAWGQLMVAVISVFLATMELIRLKRNGRSEP